MKMKISRIVILAVAMGGLVPAGAEARPFRLPPLPVPPLPVPDPIPELPDPLPPIVLPEPILIPPAD